MMDGCKQNLSNFGKSFADILLGKPSDGELPRFAEVLDQIAADWVHADAKSLLLALTVKPIFAAPVPILSFPPFSSMPSCLPMMAQAINAQRCPRISHSPWMGA